MFLPKLPTALGAALILTVAGTVTLRAQTPPVTDNTSASTPAIAASTAEPKKVEAADKSLLPVETSGADE